MSRTAPVIGMMLLLAVAVHLAPSEFPFLSLQQGLSLQASWVPLKPYAGAVHPMFLSLSRLVPVGDISFRAGLSPLWAWLLLGVLMTGLDRRRSWALPLLLAPLILRAAAHRSSVPVPSAFPLVLLLAALQGVDAVANGERSKGVWLWIGAGMVCVSAPVGPILGLALLAGLLFLHRASARRIPRYLALFLLGATPVLGVLIRSRSPLPCGLPVHGKAGFFLFSVLGVPASAVGWRGVALEVKEIASAVTWPVWVLGGTGLLVAGARLRNVCMILFWIVLAYTSFLVPVFAGAALFLFGAFQWTRWEVPSIRLGSFRWGGLLGTILAVCSVAGLLSQRPLPQERWPGRDWVARSLYASARSDSVLFLSSKEGLLDACHELAIRRDGPHWPGPVWLDRSSLGSRADVWTFLKRCPPSLGPTQEDFSRILAEAEGDQARIGDALLRHVVDKALSAAPDGTRRFGGEPRLVWELASPNDPFVARLRPIHLWASILDHAVSPMPPKALLEVSESGASDARRFAALSASRFAGLQIERRERGLPFTDPESLLRTAAKMCPNLPDLHHRLYRWLLDEGREDEAFEALEESLRLDPRNPVYLSDMAWMLQTEGQYDSALAHYRALLSMAGRNPRILMDYAGCLVSSGQSGKGIRILEKLLPKTHPRDRMRVEILKSLGLWLTSAQRPQDGLDYLEEAVALAPEDGDVLKAYAAALTEAGMPREAIAVYEELLRRRPKDPPLLVDLGVCHASLMEYDKAQQYWEEALLADPSFNEALLNLKELHETLMYFDPERSVLPRNILKRITGPEVKDSSAPPAEAAP